MEITNEFNTLRSIYREEVNNINNVLRINYDYEGLTGFILYQDSLELKNIFTVAWYINNEYILQSYYVKTKDSSSYFNPYIDNNIYKPVWSELMRIDEEKEKPLVRFFGEILKNLREKIIISEPKENINQYVNHDCGEYIYFSHIKRLTNGKMREIMYKKLVSYFDQDIAEFIKKSGHTAVFTNNIMRAKDIRHEISINLEALKFK